MDFQKLRDRSLRWDEITDVAAYGDGIVAGRVLDYDLEVEFDRLESGSQYDRGDPSSKILVKEPNLRVLAMALKSGGSIPRHTASAPVSIHIISGRVRIKCGDRDIDAASHRIVMFEPEVGHEMEAAEDSRLLLSIGRTRYEVEAVPPDR